MEPAFRPLAKRFFDEMRPPPRARVDPAADGGAHDGPRSRRPRQLLAETNSLRKGIWCAEKGWAPIPLQGVDFLGRVAASIPLTYFDLDVYCWLCWRWCQDRNADGSVSFTLYRIGQDLYGRKIGRVERQTLRASLDRLITVVVTLEGYDAISGRSDDPTVLASRAHLVEVIVDRAVDEKPDAAARGGLRGDSVAIRLAPWLTRQLAAGNYTYVDLKILRELNGLAKRLWLYLRAERGKPVGDGRRRSWIKLGDKAYTLFGMNYAQERQARAALKRAAERIEAVDPSFESVELRRAPVGDGWMLFATRIAERERVDVRARIRESLGDAGESAA
jgi:hypothetical protein